LTNVSVLAFAVSGTNIFAATYGSGVFLSTNSGTSWTKVNSGLTDNYVNTLVMSGPNLFAGTEGGAFLSTSNGTSWTKVDSGLTDAYVNALAVSGANLFAGTYNGGVFLSTNSGASWAPVNSGLTSFSTWSLAVSGSDLFVGTWDGGVWKRPLSDMITTVKDNLDQIPSHIALAQNYPNPFNPSTVITYQLPVNTLVTLKVYDELGRLVRTLVEDRQSAGAHSVTFNAASLSSGVYFYRLTVGSYVQTKKLMLIK
jgi:hypothetical protein